MEIRQINQSVPVIPKAKRVAAYARVSTGKDVMLHSLSAQISYYSDLIGKHPEWEYSGVFADEAITSTKESRPGFQKMLSECRAGKIELILTKSISRFARNAVTVLALVLRFHSCPPISNRPQTQCRPRVPVPVRFQGQHWGRGRQSASQAGFCL